MDVADLDPVNKRARVTSKGGDSDCVNYQTGTALLLPRLLAGRSCGPVFLAGRAPTLVAPLLHGPRWGCRLVQDLGDHRTPSRSRTSARCMSTIRG